MTAASWVEAERVSGKRLDRRMTYTIDDGVVFLDIRYSGPCTGCSEGLDDGSRCEECGYTGRRRRCDGAPVSQCPGFVLGPLEASS